MWYSSRSGMTRQNHVLPMSGFGTIGRDRPGIGTRHLISIRAASAAGWDGEGRQEDWKKNALGQCKSWIEEGLHPGRSPVIWTGVPVPVEGAEGKVLYVWLDAPSAISVPPDSGRWIIRRTGPHTGSGMLLPSWSTLSVKTISFFIVSYPGSSESTWRIHSSHQCACQ